MNKIKTLRIAFFSFIFLLSVGIVPNNLQAQSAEELKGTINDHYDQFAQYIKDNAPAKLAETLYTPDAKFYPPNGGLVEGTEGITKAFKGLISAGLVIKPEAHEVEVYGNHAYEYGIGTVYNKDGKKMGQERYVCIWKKVDGEWKIYRDFVKGKNME